MPRVAYFDCPTGIAGDMCLGALIHAGVPLEYLIEKLNLLGIKDEFRLRVEQLHHNGQQATKLHVDLLSEAETPPRPEAGVDSHHTFAHASSHEQHNPSIANHPQPTVERATSHGSSVVEAETTHQHNHHHHHSHTHSHSHATVQVTTDHRQIHSGSTSPHPHEPNGHAPHRHLPDIEQMIQAAGLPARVEAWSLAIFRELAKAEGYVHGIAPDQVHFHEVGATDAIVDIVGTCLGLDWLGIDRLYCSALPTGGGTVWAAHGHLPVPTPAVLRLFELHQVPLYSNGIDRELVTPTGAAIAVTLASQFGPPPAMTLQKVGLGAGGRKLAIPNILRLWIGEAGNSQRTTHSPVPQPSSTTAPTETITVLETQIDDLNPQAIGYLFDTLLEAGAVDVFTQAIGMKKSRPGILLTVVCPAEKVAACEAILFQETTTLGIRQSQQNRSILERKLETVQTPYGTVRVKIAWKDNQPDHILNVQPEYEDCAQIARQQHLPWREVHRLALEAWYQTKP